MSDFQGLYRDNFKVVLADSDELRDECYRIRHQVYCVEHDWETPRDSGMETDGYDSHALHSLLQFVPENRYVGTVRLVQSLPELPTDSFPVQEVTDDPTIKGYDGLLPMSLTAEACRICISKEARQAANDVMGKAERDIINNAMIVGLVRGLVIMSEQNNIEWWTAEMPRGFLRHLQRLGIYFTNAGSMIENRGKRQPCFTKVYEMLNTCKDNRPDVWAILKGA